MKPLNSRDDEALDTGTRLAQLGADLLLKSVEGETRAEQPDPATMAQWRREADGRLEAALARFDDQLIHGRVASTAAKEAIGELFAWIRWSLGRIPCLESTLPLTMGVLPDWGKMAEDVACRADTEPDGVDRFLRLYLAMTHELAARGFTAPQR